MSLLKVIAKVKLFSETDLELISDGILTPNGTSSGKWCKRTRVFRSDDICEITRHSAGKTLLHFYDGSLVLCLEDIQDVLPRWEKAVEQEQPTLELESDYQEDSEKDESDGED
jgi:hypothetical protein